MKKNNIINRNYGNKGDNTNLKRCEAVSDMVGAILMVSLVVIGIGAVSVVITSQSTPVDVPSMSIIPDTNANDLFLYHSGGDSLKRGEFIVRVDGEDFYPSELSLIPLGDDDGESDWDLWRVGESLVVPGKSDYSQVQIISTGGGHGSLIAGSGEAVITPTGTATATPTATPTATATPTVTPTPEPDVPVADFTADPTSGYLPLTVQFNDTSTGVPTSWLWDFGDGTTSTEENPEHVYSTFGTFTVTLTATNPSGSGNITKTDYITVIPSQSCEVEGITGSYYANENFAGTPVTRIDQRIRFADQRAIDDDRYDYDSDIADWPNPIIGRDERFSVIYEGYLMIDKEADYIFYLTSDDGSRLWIDDTLVVDNWGDHSPKEESGMANLDVGFHPVKIEMYEKTGHAVLQLEWESTDFGREFVSSFCKDECCPSPTAGFTAEPDSGSPPLTVQFSDTSSGNPTSWLWRFGDGTTSTEQNPTHIYNDAGTYNVSLKVTNAYGEDYENKMSYITVTGLPVPAAWWKFDEASGGIATDSSGNDNDGSIKGTYSRVAGACGDGLYFDGTSTYVLVPDDDSLDAPKYLTYAAWLKPEPPVNPYGMVHRYLNFTSLICKGSQDEDNYELFIRDLDGTSKFSFETYSGSYKEYSTTGFGYEYGQWQHVAFVADTDSGAAKLYINGEYAATVTSSLPDSFATNNNALTIGVQQMYSPYFFRYKGVMDEVILYTIALTDDQVREVYGKCTPSSGPGAPVAGFSVDTTSGNAPLTVTFTDTSANSPTSWLWNFGDGTTSTEQNPSHTYDDAGTYSVTLTTTNTGGTDTVTKTDYIDVSGVEISDFARFVVDEGVFVYGEKLEFNGDSINGPGSTVIITNDLKADKINGGASLLASNIYVGNTIDMDKGGADIGSQRNPGIIYAGNDMKLLQGSRNIYGRVHVKNNFELKDARIHNNVYVGGDLKLEHEPWIADDAYIYYVGKIDSPKNFPQSILDKCIKVDSVPEISMPEYSIPNARQASWYSSHGYDFDDGDKILSSGIKILSDGNYERKRGNSDDPRNIIIVSKDGDIKLENYNKPVSGILFAPKGKVTFKGDLFEGLVIAKDGFYVEQGGTDITFKNMDQFITNPADYPF